MIDEEQGLKTALGQNVHLSAMLGFTLDYKTHLRVLTILREHGANYCQDRLRVHRLGLWIVRLQGL